jgi:hypothetical protein
VANLRGFSERALIVADNVNGLLSSNSPAIGRSTSNLVVFSQQLDQFGEGLNGVLNTNREAVLVAVGNLQSSTETLKNLLNDVQAGKGLAGDLLKNEQIANEVSQIAHNLSITTSNLNRMGLWGVLWKHKPAKETAPAPNQLKTPKESSQ